MMINIFIFLQILLLTIMSLYIDPFSKKHSFSPQLTFINKIIQYYLSFFQWILYCPLLELFFNLSYSCGDKSALLPSLRSEGSCAERSPAIVLVATIASILLILVALLNLWAFRSYDFLETNILRLKWSPIRLFIFVLRSLLIAVFVFIDPKNQSTFVHIVINFIAVITLWEHTLNNPIRDVYISKDHFGCILSFSTSVWLWTILEYTNIIDLDSMVYVWLIILALSWKLGNQYVELSRVRYLAKLDDKNFEVLGSDNLDFALEELVNFSLNKRFSQEGVFLVNALIKQHLRLCNIKGCQIKPKTFQNFMESDLQRKYELVSLFVKLVFRQYIRRNQTSKIRNIGKYERIVLKYFSFLTFYNGNPIQSVFELNNMSSKQIDHSLYFKICSKLLSKSVRDSLSVYEYQQSNATASSAESERSLNVKFFAEMSKLNRTLAGEASSLLKKKIEYLEAFRNGFSEADTMIAQTRSLVRSLLTFRSELANIDRKGKQGLHLGLPKNIYLFKFISLYESVLTNNVVSALFYEEEIEKVKNIERATDQTGLTLLNILRGSAKIENPYIY
jgi:hypothetical protein